MVPTMPPSQTTPMASAMSTGGAPRSPNASSTSVTTPTSAHIVTLGPSAMMVSSMPANTVAAESATQCLPSASTASDDDMRRQVVPVPVVVGRVVGVDADEPPALPVGLGERLAHHLRQIVDGERAQVVGRPPRLGLLLLVGRHHVAVAIDGAADAGQRLELLLLVRRQRRGERAHFLEHVLRPLGRVLRLHRRRDGVGLIGLVDQQDAVVADVAGADVAHAELLPSSSTASATASRRSAASPCSTRAGPSPT